MNSHKITGTKIIKMIIQIAPFVMIAVCAVLYFVFFRHVTVEQLMKYTPENIWLASVVIVLMFSLKSLSFFFPMLVINVLCGKIAPNIAVALLINTIGTFFMLNIPYFIGRFAEREFVESLIKKNKKMQLVREIQLSNEVYFVFFLRIINLLPYDIVSMFIGSSGISWKKYVAGSMLGTLPGMICCTFSGLYLDHPTSPQFILSLVINVGISMFFGLTYIIQMRKKRAKLKEKKA